MHRCKKGQNSGFLNESHHTLKGDALIQPMQGVFWGIILWLWNYFGGMHGLRGLRRCNEKCDGG